MKIKKLNESILKEADEKAAVINAEDSGEQVLDTIEKEAEDNNLKVNSVEVASEVAGTADKINADNTVVDFAEDTGLGVKNAITDALDDCLDLAIEWKEDGTPEVPNVMICGLPGSGKTASVYDWAKHAKANGKPVHMTYLNMKNNDLDAFINGYTVQSKKDPDYVTQAFSKNLDSLDQENSILFLDEYNRQTEDQIRASALTLINEHYIVGKGNGGKRYFPNFLFTIAVMNPAIRTDRGAAKLNDAEKTRFLNYFDEVDSDANTTIEYLNKFYGKKIKEEQAKENPDYDRIEKYLRILDLGTYICKDETFEYDDKTKLGDLDRTGKKMLNQRSLTAGLAAARGDADKFLKWLERGANFLDRESTGQDTTTEMLIAILDDYRTPTREALFNAYNIEEPKEDKPEEEDNKPNNNANNSADNNSKSAEDVADVDSDLEDDDDPDFWANAGGNQGGVNSPNEIDDIFNDFSKTWNN